MLFQNWVFDSDKGVFLGDEFEQIARFLVARKIHISGFGLWVWSSFLNSVPFLSFLLFEFKLIFMGIFGILKFHDLGKMILRPLSVELWVKIELLFHLIVLLHFSLYFGNFLINILSLHNSIWAKLRVVALWSLVNRTSNSFILWWNTIIVDSWLSLTELCGLLTVSSQVLNKLLVVLFWETVRLLFGVVRWGWDQFAVFLHLIAFEVVLRFCVANFSLWLVFFSLAIFFSLNHFFLLSLSSDFL